jgi:hypothetical protein
MPETDEIIIPIILVFIVPVIISMFAHFIYVDRLIKFEYKNFKQYWEEDGEPNGYFWTAPNAKFKTTVFRQTQSTWIKWELNKPEWIAVSNIAEKFYDKAKFSENIVYLSLAIGLLSIITVGIFFKYY